MKSDSVCHIEGPTRKTVPAWIVVVLILLFIATSVCSVFLYVRSLSEVHDLQAQITELETKLSKQALGSKRILDTAQGYIDGMNDFIYSDGISTEDTLTLAIAWAPMSQTMKDICGQNCNDLRDFADQFYK